MKAGKEPERPTIFHTLLDADPSLYDKDVVEYCSGEAFAIVGAAADTTGNAIGQAAFNTITHPNIYKKLREELVAAFPNPDMPKPDKKKKKQPKQTGAVKEGLRYVAARQ